MEYKNLFNKIFFFGFTLFSISQAFASEELKNENIVVTATKTAHLADDAPVKTEVINIEDLKAKGITSLEDAFENISGLSVKKNSGAWGQRGQISLRGLDSGHTLILIDGHRVNGGHSAAVDLNSYPIEMIERIEVVKGPGSVLYGSEAMGGVINIITKSGSDKFKAGFSAGAGNRNTKNYNVNSGFGNDKAGAYLSYTYYHTDGIEKETDEYQEHKASASFDYKMSDKASMYTKFLFSREDIEEEDRTQDKSGINPGISIKPDSLSELKIFGSYFSYDHETKDKSTNYTEDILEAELNYSRLFFNRNNLTLGTQYEKTKRDDKGKGYDADEEITSFFASNEIDFYPFVAVLGLRMDSHKEWGEEYNPKISLMYKAGENFTFRASAGKAFNAPSLSKLYGSWKMGPYLVLPNENLNPETSVGYDAGIDFKKGKNNISVTFFRNEIDDLINSVKRTENGKRYLEWVNIDEAMTQGVEFDFKTSVKNLSAGLNYTYLDTEDKNTGKDIENRPNHKGDISLSYNLRNIDALFGIKGSYTGKRYEDDLNTEKLDSYWVWDVFGSIDITDNLGVFARVENLFEEEKISDQYDIDGLVFFAGINGKF
ncbi:MAG: TonB-dependent receptor [Desulfobacteraceae bacterium]|nr:TonB-dependent receptor [Desulfobacteraceae bacterium]